MSGVGDRDIAASAPGKVLLAGEYAVLAGAEAVVMAVDRRVHARAAAGMEARAARSSFLRAVRDAVAGHAGSDSAAARAAARLMVDSDALRLGGVKLGLGSSAAVTVAGCACALAHDHTPDPGLVHRLAHAAHSAAQGARGARGSGADIAASVYGGVLGVRVGPAPGEPVRVRPLLADLAGSAAHLVLVWTGTPASTPALVARVHAWRDARPQAYERAIAAVADAAGALIAALRPSAGAAEVVAAVAAGGEAVAALGRDAGVDIETPTHRAVATMARSHGGAAKPTGAGGGDLVLAAFPGAAAAAAFHDQAGADGMKPLSLRVDPVGVQVTGRP